MTGGHQGCIMYVHRIGKSVSRKPRTTLAWFLRFQDRENVLKVGFNLHETEFGAVARFSVGDHRKKAQTHAQEAKRNGQKYPSVNQRRINSL